MGPHPKACRAIGVVLAAIPLAVALAVMFTPRTNTAETITAPFSGVAYSYTATAGSGANGFALSTSGARIDVGTGANDFIASDGTCVFIGGTGVGFPALCYAAASGIVYVAGGGIQVNASNTGIKMTGAVTNGATAIATRVGNAGALSTAGAKVMEWCQDTPATCATPVASIKQDGALAQTGVTQANLGTPANGTIIYCSDCTFANPCAGGGTGAFAKRLNGAWRCD